MSVPVGDTCRSRKANLFSLPLELRQQIYSYLMPAQTTPRPIRGAGINAVSHRGPRLGLLLVNRQLTAETLDHYFSVATWKIILDHEFNYFRNDPELLGLAAWPHVSRIQKIEIVFFCNLFLLKEYPSFGQEQYYAEIKRRATRACEIFASIPALRKVSVSFIDTIRSRGFEHKAALIEPVRVLKDKVDFDIGQISGICEEDLDVFVNAMQTCLGVTSTNSQRSASPRTLSPKDRLGSELNGAPNLVPAIDS